MNKAKYRRPLRVVLAAMQYEKMDVSTELRMLKTALVYADKVDICSIATSLIIPVLLASVMSPNEMPFSVEFRREIREKANYYLGVKGVKEFLQAIITHSDLIDLRMIGFTDEYNLEPVESIVRDFVISLSDYFFSGEAIPFFDDSANIIVGNAIGSGLVELGNIPKLQSKQISLVSDLVSRLPLFENAAIDEILDIRRELETPLTNFRATITKFSREIESAPWDREFPFEAEQLFIEQCEPAILEIEEAYKSNKLLIKLLENSGKKALAIPATSAIGLVLSAATQIPDTIVQALSLTVGGTLIVTDAIREWKEEKRKVEKNSLYFYYRLDKRYTENA